MTQSPDMESQPVEIEETINFVEYVAVCQQRRWLIVSLVLLFGGIAGFWSYSQTPIYQARAKMVVEPQDPKVMDTQLQQENASQGEKQIETHIKLVTSYPVLEEVVRTLNIAQYPEYQDRPSGLKKFIQNIKTPWIKESVSWVAASIKALKRKVTSFIKSLIGSNSIEPVEPGAEENFPDKGEASLVLNFKSHVTVTGVVGSKIVDVTVESEDPEFAARASNTLVAVYMDQNLKKKSQFTEFASDWFSSHLDDLRRKVEESEQALYAYRAEHGLVNLSNQQTIAAQRLDEQNLELIRAEKERTEAQTRYKLIENIRAKVRSQTSGQKIDRSDLDSLTEVLNSDVIRDLRTREIESLVELANMAEKYGHLHPKMIQAKSKLRELQARMAEELDKVYGSVKNNYQLALARETAVRKNVKQQKDEKVALDKYSVQASLLERESNSHRQLYDLFLQQMSRTDLSTKIQTSNIYLAESAIPDMTPIRPKTPLNILMGLIVGLVSGVGLALLSEYAGKTFKGPRDFARVFEKFLVLGMVPKSPEVLKPNQSLMMVSYPMGVSANCYRHIRTSLWIAMQSEPPFSVAVTSASDHEGKTTLSANLAIALAQVEGVRVVLIDTDLRRPRVAHVFGIDEDHDKAKGLVHYLEGEAEISEILYETKVPNLAVIPAGYMPPHPTELLHSKKMRTLLQWCKEQGFSVILDTPAALPVVDAMVVGNMVSGTIVVVCAGKTIKKEAVEVLDRLKNHEINILGVVMQKAPMSSLPSYYRDSPYFAYKNQGKAGMRRAKV
jgi:polysaccharide biosynthesis transport protein